MIQSKTKKKYYVVWEGRMPGIYLTWDACQSQVEGYSTAKYKGFESQNEAEVAFFKGWKAYQAEKQAAENVLLIQSGQNTTQPLMESIAVDAAWNSVSKVMEYRGVYTKNKQLLFHQGPFQGATNNIGEFLAIVHGLAYLKKRQSNIPIYTDSITALSWVRHKKHKSVLLPTDKNEVIFQLLERAETWLAENYWKNHLIKWETKLWGEIPADFGRK